MRQLITSDQSRTGTSQHKRPCSDCPFSRSALPGWLGGATVPQWLLAAHSDQIIDCHVVSNMQCAGAAIYRANVCKTPRDPNTLHLPKDIDVVFATPVEFEKYHE